MPSHLCVIYGCFHTTRTPLSIYTKPTLSVQPQLFSFLPALYKKVLWFLIKMISSEMTVPAVWGHVMSQHGGKEQPGLCRTRHWDELSTVSMPAGGVLPASEGRARPARLISRGMSSSRLMPETAQLGSLSFTPSAWREELNCCSQNTHPNHHCLLFVCSTSSPIWGLGGDTGQAAVSHYLSVPHAHTTPSRE